MDEQDNTRGKSLALPYESEESLSEDDAPTIPMFAFTRRQVGGVSLVSPWVLNVLAGGILLLILVLVFLAATQNPPQEPAAVENRCLLNVESDTNVRVGPGFDYDRAWILEGGGNVQAFTQTTQVEEVWFQVPQGWLPRDAVTVSSASLCFALPQPDPFPIFRDDIRPPQDIVDLDWRIIMTESFSTPANGWVSSASSDVASIRRGSLVLFATEQEDVLVYPVDSPIYQEREDIYITMQAEWIASDLQGEMILFVRQTEQRGIRLVARRDGTLMLINTILQPTLLAETKVATMPDELVLGLLADGEMLRVYLGDQEVLRGTDTDVAAGLFGIGLRGQSATAQISRFEVRIPAVN